MSTKERLKEFTKFKGISERSFCATIGVSPTFISAMRKSMQPDKIESIKSHYPDLNIVWLLTGDGEMIHDPNTPEPSQKQPAYDPMNQQIELDMLKQLLDSKDKLIASQEREISTLNKQIEGKEKEVESYLREIQTLRDLVESYQRQLNTDEQPRKAI